jgi:hypothetical protein
MHKFQYKFGELTSHPFLNLEIILYLGSKLQQLKSDDIGAFIHLTHESRYNFIGAILDQRSLLVTFQSPLSIRMKYLNHFYDLMLWTLIPPVG